MIPSFQIIFGSSEVLKRWAEVQDILKLTKDGLNRSLRGGFFGNFKVQTRGDRVRTEDFFGGIWGSNT